MSSLSLHEFHNGLNARFVEVNGMEMVADYGDVAAEHEALRSSAGVIDLSARGRLCLVGADRIRFLNGQVSNNVKDLKPGSGCYAALVSAKGKMQSDMNIFALPEELLLDFEPGYSAAVTQRLDKYIIADDVQVVDASPHYGLISVQGPLAAESVASLGLVEKPPAAPMQVVSVTDPTLGEIHFMNRARLGASGFDVYAPTAALGAVADKLIAAAKDRGGRACGWTAMEMARIEAAIPRFGQDMDESNLAPETGIEAIAISYSKGCYIGQEVIARVRTYGQVAKALRGLRLADDLKSLPEKGAKLLHDGKEVGYITSAVAALAPRANLALGYARKEVFQPGADVVLTHEGVESRARIVTMPFQPFS